jgi:signal peptidase II
MTNPFGTYANWTAPRRLPWLLGLSALILTLDRLTKDWVTIRIPMYGAIPVIPHFLRISHWTNDGAAFSLFAGSASPNIVRWTLTTFGCCLVVAVLCALTYLGNRFTLITVALAFVLGGALGNLHDRILYGSVIDFIEVHIFSYHWPDFNIADSAVVTGACLIFLETMLSKGREKSQETGNREQGSGNRE